MASFGDINRVNTNIQSLDSQLSLNRINRSLAENQMRLSTGLRINRSEDDVAGFSIANKLNSRVAGLSQALANVGDAKSILDIAESSFDQVMDSLIEMKALATQASNDTLGSEERGFIAQQIQALGTDINEVANQTVFQDLQLLNGEDGGFDGELSLTFQVGERAADTVTTDISAVNLNQLFDGSSAAFTAETEDIAGTAIGGATTGTGSSVAAITVVDSAGATAGSVTGLTIDTSTIDADSMQAVADAVNDLNIDGLSASVNDDGDGLVISNASSSETYNVTITGDFSGDGTATETTATGVIDSAEASTAGQGQLDMEGWGADDFRGFMSDVDSAISSMSERVNQIGISQSSLSVREVTLSQSISANSSAVSRIMDADFAKEQSESVRLQILQQTATSALAQANIGPQSVLGFLG